LNEPIEILMKHQVDGLFLFELNEKHHTDPLRTLKLPYILVNIRSGDLPSVSSANVDGAVMAVNHLIDLGHRRIAHVKGPTGNLVAEDRLLGYRKALDRARIPYDPQLVVECEWSNYASQSTIDEEKAAQTLFSRDTGATAVFCCTDLMALGVSRLARRWGLEVPKDFSLAAFDDTWAASACSPVLSTVKQDPYTIGRRAAQALVTEVDRKLNKDPAPSALREEPCQVIPVQLLLRQSTGKPPAQAPKAPQQA
jgi:DNA-binding LacI/PurR family transcriptional regulator